MKHKIDAFELLLDKLEVQLTSGSVIDFEIKQTPASWSKKEILGHLVDSAINNIQRFAEIQYSEKPYHIRPYKQDELVRANDYQNKNTQDLFDLLIVLNRHIVYLANKQTDTTLKYRAILPDQSITDLEFVIEDYIHHFYHHLKQVGIQ